MARRYYLAQIIGTGTDADPFRPATAEHGGSYATVFPPQGADGRYLTPWCLVIVNKLDHVSLGTDARIAGLPDLTLDTGLSVLSNTQYTAMNTGVTNAGLTVTWQKTNTFRDVVRSLGRQMTSAFHEDRFDVAA